MRERRRWKPRPKGAPPDLDTELRAAFQTLFGVSWDPESGDTSHAIGRRAGIRRILKRRTLELNEAEQENVQILTQLEALQNTRAARLLRIVGRLQMLARELRKGDSDLAAVVTMLDGFAHQLATEPDVDLLGPLGDLECALKQHPALAKRAANEEKNLCELVRKGNFRRAVGMPLILRVLVAASPGQLLKEENVQDATGKVVRMRLPTREFPADVLGRQPREHRDYAMDRLLLLLPAGHWPPPAKGKESPASGRKRNTLNWGIAAALLLGDCIPSGELPATRQMSRLAVVAKAVGERFASAAKRGALVIEETPANVSFFVSIEGVPQAVDLAVEERTLPANPLKFV